MDTLLNPNTLGIKLRSMHMCFVVVSNPSHRRLKFNKKGVIFPDLFTKAFSTQTFSTTAFNNDTNILAENGHIPQTPSSITIDLEQSTLGRYLARRLVEIGVSDIFSVPGDFNLILLDHLIAEPGLNYIGCCNELNAGYVADGYARHRGIGACVVTFTVGGMSLLNAIAGAYSENVPVICIVGAPNSNDYGSNRKIHHSIGVSDFSQELKCFETVTCYQAVVDRLEDAQLKIDKAICMALKESKPVYISISCNLVAIPHPMFSDKSIPFSITPSLSNKAGLEAAVEAAAAFLNRATKPVMIGGPNLKTSKSGDAFLRLAEASGYPIAVMPSAKGLVPERHRRFIGTYWGPISSPCCAEIVESADAYLVAGPIFTDISTVGFAHLLKDENAVIVEEDRVLIGKGGGSSFGCVLMRDFLEILAGKIRKNNTAFENYERMFVSDDYGTPLKIMVSDEPIRVNVVFRHIQKMLTSQTTVIVDAGDSWFNCQKLKLPDNCGYESQMMYCSIGWSVGATLGYAQSAPEKRVIACIGDGSFQMTAQDVSTMIRNKQRSIIFLINNGGYSTEVEIHDGPYNVIHNWDYTAVVDALCNGKGKCWTAKVRTEEDLIKAIEIAMEVKQDSLCFIEVITHRDDTSKELLGFGLKAAVANSRLPNPI